MNPTSATDLTGNTARDLAVAAAVAADDHHGTDITVVDVSAILGLCEWFVICSAGNPRLVAALADRIEERVRDRYARSPISVEGLDSREWVLLDYGDVVVHVFGTETRDLYRLERLYRDAPRVSWQPGD
ncbi:MAG: ribosome silencing factor [Microthrixaceae bacterium]